MHWYSFLVATVAAGTFVAAPATAQTMGTTLSSPGSFSSPSTLSSTNPLGSPSPMRVTPGVSSSMTGGIPGTLGGTPNAAGSTIAGGIPGTLGGQPFSSGGSTTGAIGDPSTLGTSTMGLPGRSPVAGSTGAGR